MGEVAPELGMVPYGSVLRKEWYSETASHNTVTIGGRSQAPHKGSCCQFRQEGNATYLWIRSDGAYEGAVLDRHLVLADCWLLDWFHVEQVTERDQEVDLWFHPTGHLLLPFAPHLVQRDFPTLLGLEAGYGSVEVLSVMKNETDCALNTEWNIRYDGVSTDRGMKYPRVPYWHPAPLCMKFAHRVMPKTRVDCYEVLCFGTKVRRLILLRFIGTVTNLLY